ISRVDSVLARNIEASRVSRVALGEMRSERSGVWSQSPILLVRSTWRLLNHARSGISPLDPTRLRKGDDGLKTEQVRLLWPTGGRKWLGVWIEQRNAAKAVLFSQFEQLVLRAVCQTLSVSQMWA